MKLVLVKIVFVWFLVFACLVAPSVVWAAININTAGSTELQILKGIGPAYAQRIIDYREANGPFQTIEEIKNVSGIGDKTFEDIKDEITVGEVSDDDDELEDEAIDQSETETATTTTMVVSSGSTSSRSSHSSYVSLSTKEVEAKLEVSAGRERLVVVGQPVLFAAEVTAGTISERNVDFTWSFGDGTADQGQSVSHQYLLPGEYIVVLNARGGGQTAVSRTEVLVVSPNVSVGRDEVAQATGVTNYGEYEINLGEWSLTTPSGEFKLPPDTIIAPGRTVWLADLVTGLVAGPVSLHNAGSNPDPDNLAVSAQTNSESDQAEMLVILNTILTEALAIDAKIKTLARHQETPTLVVIDTSPIQQSRSVAEADLQINLPAQTVFSGATTSTSTTDSNLASTIVLDRPDGVFRSIIGWPADGLNYLQGLFKK